MVSDVNFSQVKVDNTFSRSWAYSVRELLTDVQALNSGCATGTTERLSVRCLDIRPLTGSDARMSGRSQVL